MYHLFLMKALKFLSSSFKKTSILLSSSTIAILSTSVVTLLLPGVLAGLKSASRAEGPGILLKCRLCSAHLGEPESLTWQAESTCWVSDYSSFTPGPQGDLAGQTMSLQRFFRVEGLRWKYVLEWACNFFDFIGFVCGFTETHLVQS